MHYCFSYPETICFNNFSSNFAGILVNSKESAIFANDIKGSLKRTTREAQCRSKHDMCVSYFPAD